MSMSPFFRALCGVALVGAISSAKAAEVSGAGASFPFPIYAKWADEYKKQTGVTINYQSIGSGGGIKQIKAKTVNFGATDAPLKGEELQSATLVQWPMVMGAITPVVNIDGVNPGELTLDGATLAKIFMGDIKSWDDNAIKQLNPNVKLPNQPIVVVHRADGSGTTFNFTDYLAKVSPDWKSKVGSSTAVDWPTGVGAKGNEGVAANVANAKGAIGYVEYAYAKQNKMSVTQLINKAGKKVAPSSESVQAAAVNANWQAAPGFYQILTDEPGDKSWPISAATFILMQKTAADPQVSIEALKFFDWAYKNGAASAEALDYVPMPQAVASAVESEWTKQFVGQDGKPLLSDLAQLGKH